MSLRNLVESALGTRLSPRDRMILNHRIGWGDEEPLRQVDLAHKLKMSQPGLSIAERALRGRLQRVVAQRRTEAQAHEASIVALASVQRAVLQQAAALGITPEELRKMAEKDPDAEDPGEAA
jgi:hypothetical protein